MQNTYREVTLVVLLAFLSLSAEAGGKRTNFLSKGPSPAVFGTGDAGTAAAGADIAGSHYNPALLSALENSSISFACHPLTDGTVYGFCGAGMETGKTYLAFSAINIRSGDIEIRQKIDDTPEISKASQWAWNFSAAIKAKRISAGITMRYIDMALYRYRGSGFGADCGVLAGIRGPRLPAGRSELTLGASVLNALSPEITMISEKEIYERIFRAGIAFKLPVIIRLSSKDTVTIKADGVFDEGSASPRTGIEYSLMERIVFRAGYYPDNISAGAGFRLGDITIDYSYSHSEFAGLNRFGLSYSFARSGKTNKRRGDSLMIEAGKALVSEKEQRKQEKAAAKPLFQEAVAHFNKGELLYASDILSELITTWPEFDGPSALYARIRTKIDGDTANDICDIAGYSYAQGYKAYFSGELEKAVVEWEKYSMFRPESQELSFYMQKALARLADKLKIEEERSKKAEAESIMAEAESFAQAERPVAAVKSFEKARQFCRENKFPGAAEISDRASKRITDLINRLSMAVKKKPSQTTSARTDIDERSSDEKYMEGLVHYARGKAFDAMNCWEIALRLNPDNERAKKALEKVRKNR